MFLCFELVCCLFSAMCMLDVMVGPCEALMLRYYYNTKTGQCENFFYGGCMGDANNFKTLQECMALCH